MLVGKHMSTPVITISPDTPLVESLNLMHKENVRRFPVVNQEGKLVGIVLERDLLHASPSAATSLSVWELNYLISKISVDEIMTRDVITITEDAPLEEAARIMVENQIGGLPVIRDGRVIGMITETDIFKVFMKVLGAKEKGVRLVVQVPNVPGKLAQLSKAIFEKGGNLIALVADPGENEGCIEITLKLIGLDLEEVKNTIKPYVDQIIDVRLIS